jgi:hypothetical protein
MSQTTELKRKVLEAKLTAKLKAVQGVPGADQALRDAEQLRRQVDRQVLMQKVHELGLDGHAKARPMSQAELRRELQVLRARIRVLKKSVG